MTSRKTILITGGTSGIGRALVEHFDQASDYQVFFTARDERKAEELKQSLQDSEYVLMNFSRFDSVVQGAKELEGRLTHLDILINNAGISRFAPIDNDDYEIAWHESIAVLLTAHTLTIRAALPHLRKANNPRIVNIASTEGLGATRYGSPYTAAKTGVIGLTRSLAVELGPEKITVNCVCPGPINTGMTSTISEEDKAVFARRRTALRRYAEPEEVAHGTLGLVLPASQYITGATLPVDGGLTIRNA